MPDQPFAAPQTTVACPFCGLGCDDLSPLRRNDDLSVLEEAGWMISSLGEARNPADLVVLVGNSRTERFPRLAERILKPTARLHAPTEATLVELHTAANDADAQAASAPHQPDAAASDAQASADTALRSGQLRDFVGVLRARLANRPLDRGPFPAAALAERLTAAACPLIAFSAADLQSEPQPDLAVRALAALVRQLNEGGRAAPLPLRGADGESSAHQVSAWHTGYSIRQQFPGGVPRYESHRGHAQRLLESEGADLLLWISPLNHEPPPVTSVPTLVFGHPGMTLEREPEVFIPLAVPGVHRAGAATRWGRIPIC